MENEPTPSPPISPEESAILKKQLTKAFIEQIPLIGKMLIAAAETPDKVADKESKHHLEEALAALQQQLAGQYTDVGDILLRLDQMGSITAELRGELTSLRLYLQGNADAQATQRFERAASAVPELKQFTAQREDTSMPTPGNIFISFAEEDLPVVKELEKTLKPLTRKGAANIWTFKHIQAGQKWRQEIDTALAEAGVTFLIISRNFLASDFVDENELPQILKRAEEGQLTMLTLFASPVASDAITAVLEFQALNGPNNSLIGMSELAREEFWSSVYNTVKGLLPNPNLPSPLETKRETERANSDSDAPALKLEAQGGAVPLASPFYISRVTDTYFCEALARRDGIIRVEGERGTGKSSLLRRGVKTASDNMVCLFIDFAAFPAADLANSESFYYALTERIADQLNLPPLPADPYAAARGPQRRFERFIEKEVLPLRDKEVLWSQDNVDKLFACNFKDDFFGLLRAWFNARSGAPESIWAKLMMVIAYAANPEQYVTNLHQSPFNVGTKIRLTHFTLKEVEELNARYRHPIKSAGDVARLHRLYSGHPYYTRRAFDDLAANRATLTDLETRAKH